MVERSMGGMPYPLDQFLDGYTPAGNFAEGGPWRGGMQLDALRAVADAAPRINYIAGSIPGSRVGRAHAVLSVDMGQPLPLIVLWRDTFCRCGSGDCDRLEGRSALDYVRRTLDKPQHTYQFWTIPQAREFLATTTSMVWASSFNSYMTLLADL